MKIREVCMYDRDRGRFFFFFFNLHSETVYVCVNIFVYECINCRGESQDFFFEDLLCIDKEKRKSMLLKKDDANYFSSQEFK